MIRFLTTFLLLSTLAVLTASAANPHPRGSNAWWEHRLAHDDPKTAPITGRTHKPGSVRSSAKGSTDNGCDCSCVVANAEASLPFDCRCDCDAPPVGKTGPVGPKGAKGEQGLPGPKGRTGERGPKGSRGKVGVKGPKGEKGFKGLPGKPGNDGVDGRKIRGLQGPKGRPGKARRGPRGLDGARGPQGRKGNTGVAGRPVRGPTGKRGQRGRIGDTGDKGSKGVPGPRGAPGPIGAMGPAGDAAPKWSHKGIFGMSIAQAACTGVAGKSWVSAVWRDCGEGRTCDEICGSTKTLGGIDAAGKGAKFQCSNALKIDEEDPTHAYKFAGCSDAHCGPNYCCCFKSRT